MKTPTWKNTMAERLRVVQMVYTFDVEAGGGGLSSFAIELARHLDPTIFESKLISLGYSDSGIIPEIVQQLDDQGITSFSAITWDKNSPYKSFIHSFNSLKAEFTRQPVHILHSHSEFTDVAAVLLKLWKKAPVIMRTVHYGHQVEWRENPFRRFFLTNFLYPIFFDHEIGINQFNTDRLNNRFFTRLLQRQATYLPNAIPVEKFINIQVDQQSKKKSMGIPEDAQVIGTIGRLTSQKGFSYLIDAIPQVLANHPHGYFLIIGDGPLAEELQEQSELKDVSPHILFVGRRSDVNEIFAFMDLFVSSSLWEGIPTVILESMASNVPVLATSIPGTTELVQHGVNGWMVPPKDPQVLSQGINHLLNSPSLRQELAIHAQETVQNYSIQSITQEYEKLYLRTQIDD
jgi:glycosyltransferase involved in cell wall biosynthesis